MRQSNIRIGRVKEDNKEGWKERLDIENVEIERAHRAGRRSRNKRWTIFWKVLRFKNKQNILRKGGFLKGADIFIKEDYYKDTVECRKELWEEEKYLRAQGKIAYFNYRTTISRNKVPTSS